MRFLPLTDADRAAMLKAIGVDGVDALYRDVPEAVRRTGLHELPPPAGELEVSRALKALAAENLGTEGAPSFLGAGAYRHHVPAAVDALIQRGEFLTAYTPYQPEISQGTLQAMFEFQTQVALITGMEVANASMYDGSTACAEAVQMACRATKRKRVLLSGGLHPHSAEVVETLTRFTDVAVKRMLAMPPQPGTSHETGALEEEIDSETACVVVQQPDVFGLLRDFSGLAEACHAVGALLVVAVLEPVSLGAVMPPGAYGADIVVGEGQGLGSGLNFGGPYLGLFATHQRLLRQMPGRLVGETVDADGKRGWVLTLSTREQHIRRGKATSNICTNSGLCALAFSIHMALLGEANFRCLAALNHALAVLAAERLDDIAGVTLLTGAFFNEFALCLARPAAEVVEKLVQKGILAGVPAARLFPEREDLDKILLVTVTEMNDEGDIERLCDALERVLA